MASFCILVTHSPFDTQQAYSAYRFADAAIKDGHAVAGIFFYQSGVNNSNSFQTPHADELAMFQKWKALNDLHLVPLNVCVTAANRRGIINKEDAIERDLVHYNLTAPFEEVGLGELIELINGTDRIIQF